MNYSSRVAHGMHFLGRNVGDSTSSIPNAIVYDSQFSGTDPGQAFWYSGLNEAPGVA